MPEKGAPSVLDREKDMPKTAWTYFIVLSFLSVDTRDITEPGGGKRDGI